MRKTGVPECGVLDSSYLRTPALSKGMLAPATAAAISVVWAAGTKPIDRTNKDVHSKLPLTAEVLFGQSHEARNRFLKTTVTGARAAMMVLAGEEG